MNERYSSLVSKGIHLIPSALIFSSGVGALYIADLLIVRFANSDIVSSWATLKSFVMIASVFAMFGLPQVLVREPHAAGIIFRTSSILMVLVSLTASYIAYELGLIASFLIGAASVLLFSITNLLFQWFRANLHFSMAYIVNSGWRIFFLIIVLYFVSMNKFDLGYGLIAAFIINIFGFSILLLRKHKTREIRSIHHDVENSSAAIKVGTSYFLATLSLSIASYGEHIVVYHIGHSEDVALYFRAAVLFLFPGIALNQFLAAILGPTIRQNETVVINTLTRYFLFGLVAIFFLWPVLLFIGCILQYSLFPNSEIHFSLGLIFSLTSCVRLFYVIPSSFVSMAADQRQLRNISYQYLGCALMLPALSVLFNGIGISVVLSVAMANLANWIFRCVIGVKLVKMRVALASD